jgi:hypothetical protein
MGLWEKIKGGHKNIYLPDLGTYKLPLILVFKSAFHKISSSWKKFLKNKKT